MSETTNQWGRSQKSLKNNEKVVKQQSKGFGDGEKLRNPTETTSKQCSLHNMTQTVMHGQVLHTDESSAQV